jgi:TonB-linked SusC/RagA family outer membrane protein
MKTINKILWSIAVLCLTSCVVFAQQELSGSVVDADNRPVPGVHVEVQEKGFQVTTDSNGNFTIHAQKGDVLVFIKPDILTEYYDIRGSKETIRVKVTRSMAEAGEGDNVQIPFDVRKRREINGSVSTLNYAQLPQLPLSSLTNALSGRIPGLYIAQTGSQPGNDMASVLVRKNSTFTGSSAPLILVDGVERDFPDMDLNEIEDFTVLKDAASLAWYGNRGANGVVLVTTKRGSAEKTRFTYDTQLGLQLPTNLARPLDSYTFATQYNQALQNDGFAPLYSQDVLSGYQQKTDPYKYPDNNYMDSFFKKSSFVQRHVFTASGGSRAIRYFTTLSYFDQNGLYKNAGTKLFDSNVGYKRYNLRTNLDIQVTPLLKVQLDMGGRVESRTEPGSTNATFLSTVFTTPPNAFPLLNEDGSYGGSTIFRSNPLAQLKAQGNRNEVTRVLLGTVNAHHKLDFITKGLSANLFYTFDIQGRYTNGRSQDYEVYERAANGALTRYGTQTPLGYFASTFSDNIRVNELWTGLDYRRSFGMHSVKANFRYQQAVSSAANRFDNKRQGFSGRVSYDLKNKYYADLVGSYAGSDNYMPGKQFGFFPAAAIGWVISEENFLSNKQGLSYLKLRASLGRTGNNATGENSKFPYAYLMTPSNGSYAFGTGFTTQAGASEGMLPNQNITWEKAFKTDIGLDAKFLKNALSLSATYFNERRYDILTNPIYPSIIGLASYRVNDGETKMGGLEGMLDYTKQFGDLLLSVGGNFTYVKNEILRTNESAGLVGYQQQAGHNIGAVSGMGKLMLQADGIFKSQAEIDGSPVQRFAGKIVPGDIRYKDVNQDGVIDNFDRVTTDFNDLPNVYYGINVSGKYRAFDFSLLAQGVGGRHIQIRTLVLAGNNNTGYINQFSGDAWTSSNPGAPYPRLGITDRGNNTADSDFWIRSGDYLRLKSIELGYMLAEPFTDRLHLRGVRVYINGFNLFNLNKTGLDIDPELPFSGYNSYPYLRTLTAGVNIKF